MMKDKRDLIVPDFWVLLWVWFTALSLFWSAGDGSIPVALQIIAVAGIAVIYMFCMSMAKQSEAEDAKWITDVLNIKGLSKLADGSVADAKIASNAVTSGSEYL